MSETILAALVTGDLTDHRDGTIAAKMGTLADFEEACEIMRGGIEE